MLTLPRYIAVTRDPRAFMGTGWQKTGPLRTDYSDWKTYAWDWTFLLSGMQTWVDEVRGASVISTSVTSVCGRTTLAGPVR
jgi:hypothetical protein